MVSTIYTHAYMRTRSTARGIPHAISPVSTPSFSLVGRMQTVVEPRIAGRVSIARAARSLAVNTRASASVADGSVTVILLAGGVGKRMKATMPKQYLPLRDQPIATYR